jgi:uncharacterized membrane protein
MDNFIKAALFIQIIAIVTVLLDIPILRVLIGFVYVTFLPGLLLLRLLKLDLKSIVEIAALAVGLSIAFSMFIGLLLNELLPLIGMPQPLSTLPILVGISSVLLLITFLGRNRVGWTYTFSLLSQKQLVLFGSLAIAPVLSIFGAVYHNSTALVLMAVIISVVVAGTIFFRKSLPTSFFPVAIAVIALSLLFQNEFISQNITGWDTFGEFYVFNSANTNALWNSHLNIPQTELRDYNSMLSVTILYSKLMDIQGEWIFKIVYFIVFAFVPITMYQMYKNNFGKVTSFLATFYFVLFPFFYVTVRRQMIAELFLVLILLVILTGSISPKKKELLIAIFGIALVVSHYSTFYVFMFCALFAWLSVFVMEKLSKKPAIEIKKALTLRVLLLIGIFAVFWYSFASTSLAQTFIEFINRLATTFIPGFSDIASRGGTVSGFIAPSFSTMTWVAQADYFISKIPYLLIPLGLIMLIRKRKQMKIQSEYIPMAFAAVGVLILTFVLPSLADSLVEGRWFNLLQIFIAPLCFYGGINALTWVSKHATNLKKARSIAIGVLCILFVVIFLFKVGFVHEVTGDVYSAGASASFSFNQMQVSSNPQVLQTLYGFYVPDSDKYSAEWLSYTTTENTTLYADADARQHVLRGYALRVVNENNIFYNGTTISPDSYIYLRTFNTQGYFISPEGTIFNMTQISNQLEYANKIYSNGDSEIYLLGAK